MQQKLKRELIVIPVQQGNSQQITQIRNPYIESVLENGTQVSRAGHHPVRPAKHGGGRSMP